MHSLTSLFSGQELDTFEKVEKEVEALQSRIFQLQLYRHTLSPTYQFPPEVLARVFSHVQDVDQPTSRQWIVVTHVSQYWRAAALSSPTLWTEIAVDRLDAVRAWLKRSGDCHLLIMLTRNFSNRSLAGLRLVFLERRRIWRMVLDLSSSPPEVRALFTKEIWRGFNGGPAPILESISTVDVLLVGPTYPSHQVHFSANAPHLHTLELKNSAFTVSSAFSGLTSFSIINRNIHMRLSVGRLLLAVQGMRGLKHIHLEGGLSSNGPIFRGKIYLPYLSRLHLQDTALNLQGPLTLLKHLTIPPDTFLSLLFGIRTSTQAAFAEFFHIYSESRARKDNSEVPITVLEMFWTGSRADFKGWVEFPKTGCLSQRLHLGFYGLPSQDNSRLWANELRHLPLAKLLVFVTNCDLGHGPWEHTFGSLQTLRAIMVEGEAIVELLEYINQNSEDHLSHPPSCDDSAIRADDSKDGQAGACRPWTKKAFPHLLHLHLVKFNFTLVNVHRFLDSLRARRRHGFGLLGLFISDCTAEDLEGLVAKLDKIVPTVTWDGRQP